MASRNGRATRRASIVGNTPDPHAVPVGLETWRARAGDSEYALFAFPIGETGCWKCLTPRERMVASEMLHGRANSEIADRLQVAERTVANQVASIFRKLGVGSRAELASLFVRNLGQQSDP